MNQIVSPIREVSYDWHMCSLYTWLHHVKYHAWLLNCWSKIWSLQEEFEDTKGVIRIHKSKKDRQYTDQEKKSKWTNNDLQNITHKTLDIVFGN